MPGPIRFKINTLAEARDLNIEKLARKADLGRNTVAQIWHNKTQNPGLEVLRKLAVALEVDITELYEEQGGSNPSP